MINTFLNQGDDVQKSGPKEGELYKVFNIHGEEFSLYYGYYEDCDRDNPLVEPMPIYPDFVNEPRHTKSGFPFVTKMQDSCKYYCGKAGKFNECAECEYYSHGQELLGICTCIKNKKIITEDKE